MSTYAIGDVQGCFDALQMLLQKIQFNPACDILWFTGDLVNRGPQSLEVLRFVKSIDKKQVTVLGNHDLHLLAVAYGVSELKQADTLDAILQARDKEELIDWLRHRPLLHHETGLGYTMVHAGLAPAWSIGKAAALAHEVETALQANPIEFLKHLYGNQPDLWQDQLTGNDRLRCIVNYFTRMRFCYRDGRLDFHYKGEIHDKPSALIPWFDVPDRLNAQDNLIFGHWAALGGKTTTPHLFPLDTGCVWGNYLTALRLEDGQRFSVPCLAVKCKKQ